MCRWFKAQPAAHIGRVHRVVVVRWLVVNFFPVRRRWVEVAAQRSKPLMI